MPTYASLSAGTVVFTVESAAPDPGVPLPPGWLDIDAALATTPGIGPGWTTPDNGTTWDPPAATSVLGNGAAMQAAATEALAANQTFLSAVPLAIAANQAFIATVAPAVATDQAFIGTAAGVTYPLSAAEQTALVNQTVALTNQMIGVANQLEALSNQMDGLGNQVVALTEQVNVLIRLATNALSSTAGTPGVPPATTGS